MRKSSAAANCAVRRAVNLRRPSTITAGVSFFALPITNAPAEPMRRTIDGNRGISNVGITTMEMSVRRSRSDLGQLLAVDHADVAPAHRSPPTTGTKISSRSCWP